MDWLQEMEMKEEEEHQDQGISVGEEGAGGMVPAQLATLPCSCYLVLQLQKVVSFWQAGPIRQKATAFVRQRMGQEN